MASTTKLILLLSIEHSFFKEICKYLLQGFVLWWNLFLIFQEDVVDDDDDDDLDLFGDETEDYKKAAEAREAAKKASPKKKESEIFCTKTSPYNRIVCGVLMWYMKLFAPEWGRSRKALYGVLRIFLAHSESFSNEWFWSSELHN